MTQPIYVHLRRDGSAWLVRFEDPEGRLRKTWTENWYLPVPRRRAPFRFLLWQILEFAREKGLLDGRDRVVLKMEGEAAELLRALPWSPGGSREDRQRVLQAASAIKTLLIIRPELTKSSQSFSRLTSLFA